MNKEQTIQMAQEAGGFLGELPRGDAWLFYEEEQLERFAALVRAAERKRLADKIAVMPFGDTAASFAVWIRNGGEG